MAILLIFLALLVICFLGMRALMERCGIPPVGGYLFLGWAVQFVVPYISSSGFDEPLSVLAQIGIILLLFHIGLSSHVKNLLRFVGKAGIIALIEIGLVGAVAYLVGWSFGVPLVARLIMSVALTATSLGVATYVWPEKALTKTPAGSLLLDVATIDDLVGVLAMTILLGLLPFAPTSEGVVWGEIALFLLGVVGLILLCYLFSHFVEPWLMKRLIKYERMPDAMLTTIAIGGLIASLAALIQFSFVIGAFFAGIAFSRDPKAVKINISMQSLLDLFVPFFFFWMGYQTSVSHVLELWPLFLSLLVVTALAKFVGCYLPARWLGFNHASALMVGISMIPLAEIALVITEQGATLGLVSPEFYSVISCIVFLTCAITPLAIKYTYEHTFSPH